MTEQNKTLAQAAQEHEGKQTKNISELNEVPLNMEVFDGDGQDSDGVKFFYKYIVVNDTKYRVPGIVLGQIKVIQEQSPNTKLVKVIKNGSGRQTTYQVIPK